MKKLIVFACLSLVLLACGISDIPLLAQPTATETEIPIPQLPTITPQPPIPPTYTLTPTLIGQEPSFTPIESGIGTAPFFPTITSTPTLTPVVETPSGPQPELAGTGFDSVNISTDTFYWGSCEPGTVTLTAQVSNPSNALSVVMFLRFRYKSGGGVTGWDKGTSMNSQGGGAFAFTLKGGKMGVYTDSWVEYQFVGTDAHGQNVARSPVFTQSLSLSPCQ